MKVTVRHRDKTMQVDGLPCGIPGLAIVRQVDPADRLDIIHVRSGLALGLFRDASPEAVLAASQEVGVLADWTVAGTALQPDEGLAGQVREIVRRWGGSVNGPVLTGATDIAGVTA